MLTSRYPQDNVLLDIIEPARHLYAAAVCSAVTFVGTEDSQGDVASRDTPPKLVSMRLLGEYPGPISVEKLLVAFGVGTWAFAPAHAVAGRP